MKTTSTWPDLQFSRLQDTLETLHQYIQVIGKIRLKTMPWQNHSWHSTLYITPNGFSTQTIPYHGGAFQIDLDFKHHRLIILTSWGDNQEIELKHRTIADFYQLVLHALKAADINVHIYVRPNEMDPAIPFTENTTNKIYIPEEAHKLWQAMLRVQEVFLRFRSGFIGKVSPVHLFWGAFDLAVTRFSGKRAPVHPGGMPNMPLDVMQEAYSHEVSSAGFWPGSKDFPTPIFYAYAYPVPDDFASQSVQPAAAFYREEMGEFMLKYEDVRQAADPEKMLMDFLQTTYEAAAKTLKWDREALEK
jgi:hypothetical protein